MHYITKLEMWVNARRDGRTAEYRQVAPSVQHRKVWLTSNTGMPCSNAAKTRNPLKFAGVPQTRQRISATSGPKYTIIIMMTCGGDIAAYHFFPIADTCLSCEDIARQSCGMVRRWRLFGDFLRPVFSASRGKHVSEF